MKIDQRTPWTYDYNPYRAQDGAEIPCFEIVDCDGRRVATTDEDTPHALQEADACLMAGAPALLDALEAQTEAAQAVIDAWEQGDLAGAVRQLDASLGNARAAISEAKGGAS
jgi:hypothetical protein